MNEGPASKAFKGIGSLIGLATEAHAHSKEKKAAQKERELAGRQDSSTAPTKSEPLYGEEQADEEDWALDEASAELLGDPPAYEEMVMDPKASITTTLQPAALTQTMQPLPYPVILPQRRPQTQSRGLVRAYAPLLGECKGIDETTFFNFLKEFHKFSQASPVLYAVNAAAMVVGMAPSPIAMAVSMSVSATSNIAIDVQARQRTNVYLNQVNDTLFHPRNLHCMIMTYKPDRSGEAVIDVDVNATNAALMKSISKPGKFQASSGTSKGEFAIPQAAPLVFPTIDEAIATVAADGQPLPEKKQNAMKRSGIFVNQYLDRRAQAEFAGANGENAKLAIPGATEQKFASRYADPNHPANSGSLMALLTGGTFDPKGMVKGRVSGAQAQMRGRQYSEQEQKNMSMNRRDQVPGGFIRNGVKKIMGENVVYLLIAEMPSREEMEAMTRQQESGRVQR